MLHALYTVDASDSVLSCSLPEDVDSLDLDALYEAVIVEPDGDKWTAEYPIEEGEGEVLSCRAPIDWLPVAAGDKDRIDEGSVGICIVATVAVLEVVSRIERERKKKKRSIEMLSTPG